MNGPQHFYGGTTLGLDADLAVATQPATSLEVMTARAEKLACWADDLQSRLDRSLQALVGPRAPAADSEQAQQIRAPGGYLEQLHERLDRLENALRAIEGVSDGFRGAVG
ncbi:hypothetical protein [Inquilinus sp.]|uniref:hypothetical protein n=1 Tax=Inquilinus sp. TaxID=1932117 RepID=UPI0031D27E6B